MNLKSARHTAPFCLGILLAIASIPGYALPPKEVALHDIGRRTILAIAHGDSAYISSIVDPQGILIGYDGVKHSAASFRDDLARHTGLYCELFEKGCKTDHNPGYTLGHVFNTPGWPRDADLKSKIDGESGTIECWEFGGDGDLIATLSYRFVGGRWYLYDIHYV